MHDGALLVNVAWGGLVDTCALVAEPTPGRLRAAIDVVDPEPLPAGHPLWAAPNCVITPDVGGNTTAFEPRMRALVYDQLTRLIRGGELAKIVARPSRRGRRHARHTCSSLALLGIPTGAYNEKL